MEKNYGFDRYSFSNRTSKRRVIESAPEPAGKVRRIKPPKTKERAEPQTIATILLRRNKPLFNKGAKFESVRCLNLLSYSEERPITEAEAYEALALIAVLKAGK